MPQADPLRDLELLLRSRTGLILLETIEEDRAQSLLRHLADAVGIPLFCWSAARGLRRIDRENVIYETSEPLKALAHIEASNLPALYHLRGFGPHLQDARIAARLDEVARVFRERRGAVVLTGTDLDPPESLRQLCASLRLPAPRPEEYRQLLQHILRDLSARGPVKVELSAEERNSLLQALAGLTLLEAEKVLTKAIVEDGRLAANDIAHVIRAKTAVVEREGLLEYYPVEESLADIADLAGLKGWLGKRRAILAEPERARQFGLAFPKGILLLGVPGCGKSLCAKAVATEWRLPLLKLDPASLYNKYVGESERNFRRAMQTAEKLAPVVLWIDEIEKAFAVGGGTDDGGLSTRILGTFLSWLQDRRGDVFVVATANDVSRLPAELLRKGRFDEIFFVDLPDPESRAAVWQIHLRKRNQDPTRFELTPLVDATAGFSGADIEQVIVSALYTAFASQAELTERILHDEIAATRPLSVTMAERIAQLRSWKEGRTVSAH